MTRSRPVPAEETLSRVIEDLRRIPDRFRVFDQTPEDAARKHGISADLLATLTEVGLPSAASRYDSLDLANVSLALALPAPRLLAMRGWSAAIRSAANTSTTTYTVTLEPNCQDHQGPCTVETAAPLREQPEYRRSPAGVITITRRVGGRAAREYPEVTALTSLARPIPFYLIPDELRTDIGFLRETGLGDCGLVARYLVQEAAALGLTARFSFGLFIAAPYSVPHSWFDLYLDGTWVSFDPHLLNALTDRSLLPAQQWPPHRSIGDAAWRLGDDEFQIATHNGQVDSVSFPTRAGLQASPS